MSAAGAPRRIGYILRSYPRLSQTFIVNEILALEQLGVSITIFAIVDPHEPIVQPQVAKVRAPVHYLTGGAPALWLAFLFAHLALAISRPRSYFQALRYVMRERELDAGYTASSRYACFWRAGYLAWQARRARLGHLHAHFAHDPTLIALLAQMLTGITFSFTAHARDLYQIPARSLVERADAATAVVTCCGPNMEYLRAVAPDAARAKTRLIHHGVDLDGFQPLAAPAQPPAAAGPLILSVGRLVEKKGFPDLLCALHQVQQSGRRFRCLIYGDGPQRAALTALIAELGLDDVVRLEGERGQHELAPIFQRADLFALTPFVTDDGDRDGVPNVLVEAMACGTPVVSTAVAGIPELVRDGRNGLLAAAHDVAGIAAALTTLIDNAGLRAQLGAAARTTVVEHFDLRAAAQTLAGLFAAAPGARRDAATPAPASR